MALSRYGSLKLVKERSTQRLRYESFPKIMAGDIATDSDFFIKWDESMRMDSLANQYLGDGRYWWAICLANDLTFPFGQLVAGDIIRIPSSIENILRVIERSNR